MIGLAFVFASLPSVLVLAFISPLWAAALAVACGGYASPLWLSRRGLFGMARATPIVVANLTALAMSAAVGKDIGVQNCFFMLAVLPFVLFDIRHKVWIVARGAARL